MSIAARLAELNLELPSVATPVGAYVPAQRHGDLIITSGQLPVREGEMRLTGKVGAEVEVEHAYDLARTCFLNGLAAAAEVAGSVEQITGVAKVVAFVASAPTFTAQAQVANGASDLAGEIFGEAGAHVRSAVGVAVLPLDAPVEIELTFTTS